MRDDVHIRSDGRLIYNRQDGCVDTSYTKYECIPAGKITKCDRP